MDTIDLGNSESLVCGVFPNQDGIFMFLSGFIGGCDIA